MKLNTENLTKLYNYFLEGGSVEYADVAKFLNVSPKDEKGIDEAIAQLQEKYPKLREEVEAADKARKEPQKEAVVESPQFTGKVTGESQITKVILINEDGFGEDLKIISNKNGKLAVERIIPTDEVTIKVAGKDVVVDVLKLRKMVPTEQLHGVSVQTLILLAGIAKGV